MAHLRQLRAGAHQVPSALRADVSGVNTLSTRTCPLEPYTLSQLGAVLTAVLFAGRPVLHSSASLSEVNSNVTMRYDCNHLSRHCRSVLTHGLDVTFRAASARTNVSPTTTTWASRWTKSTHIRTR